MSRLSEFLGQSEGQEKATEQAQPQGIEWFACVLCQTCGEEVEEQTLIPTEKILLWTCDAGHRSFIEGYSAF